jgi:integrase
MRLRCASVLETAIFEALRSTGCRVNELANILVEDLNLDQSEVYVRKPKRKVHWEKDGGFTSTLEPRYTVLDEDAVQAIRVYLKAAGKGDKPKSRLFPRTTRAMREMVHRWANTAGIQRPEEVHPHTFRHTRGTYLLANGVPQPYILQMLGWSKGSKTFEKTYQNAPRDIVRDRVLKAGKGDGK